MIPLDWSGAGRLAASVVYRALVIGLAVAGRRVPIELTREGRTVHTLGRWEPLWQVSLRLRPWR